MPLDTALVDLPVVEISKEQGSIFSHGQAIDLDIDLPEGAIKVVADGIFIGTGERNASGHLKVKRGLASQQDDYVKPE